MLSESYKTKSTVSERRARCARTNSHPSNMKRRTPTRHGVYLHIFIYIFAHICIYLCAEVGGRILTFDFRYKKLKILPFMVTNVEKDGTFPGYSCFSTIDSFRFEEIVSGNGAFQEI